MLVFDINVPHSSVATRLRCGGIFHNDFIANLPLSLSVKEFLKSVNIWRSYRQKYSGMFFWLTVCRLRIFAGPPIYYPPGNVIPAAVGFVYINPQPQFQNFGKILFGALSSPATPKEKISAPVWVLVYSYLRVRFELPISFRDINGFP